MNLYSKVIGEGSPLLILHGLFGSGDNWFTLAKQLGEHYTVYLIDLRNHGQSPHSNEWNYKVMADDVEEFCNTHQLNKVYLAGHSMGGKTAMKMSEMYPERIRKMMVIDIAPKYYKPHHQTILEALCSLDFNILKSRKEADEHIQKYINDFGTRQFLLKNLYWVNDNHLGWRFNLPVIFRDIENVGEATPHNTETQINIPTLFVRGEKSNYITSTDEELIKSIYPKSQLINIPNSGHWVHAENPQALFNAFTTFFV